MYEFKDSNGIDCTVQKSSPFAPAVEDVNFLSDVFDRGLGYSSLATARSVLGNFISVPGCSELSKHPLIRNLLKGVFNKRPPQPRYTVIWDSTLVIKYLATLKNVEINLEMLSLKVCTLLTILSGQRVSTVHVFHLRNLEILLIWHFSISLILSS